MSGIATLRELTALDPAFTQSLGNFIEGVVCTALSFEAGNLLELRWVDAFGERFYSAITVF
ncbi:MAG: hypothetical protein WAZ34_04365 [Rhodocyclaceae bacterium]